MVRSSKILLTLCHNRRALSCKENICLYKDLDVPFTAGETLKNTWKWAKCFAIFTNVKDNSFPVFQTHSRLYGAIH